MLSLLVRVEDVPGPWEYRQGRLRAGRSWVEPLRYPCLETVVVTDDTSTCLVVRERTSGTASPGEAVQRVDRDEYRRIVAGNRGWPLETCLVEFTGDRLVIEAGVWGTAPVHLAAAGTLLHGSWDPWELRAHTGVGALDEREVMRLLTYQQRYAHQTLFRGVHRLTERARAVFDTTGLTLHYPPPAEHALAREMAPHADAVTGFEQVLDEVHGMRALDLSEAVVQLSGGMDSATVALTMARRHRGRSHSCGILISGQAATQQRRRRQAIVSAGRYTDTTIAGTDHAPLHPGGVRRAASGLGALDEPYAEATAALLDQAAEHGIRAVLTGFGGDELMHAPSDPVADRHARQVFPWLGDRVCDLLPEVDEGIAPARVVPESTLLSVATVSTLAVRRGLWPISPLAAPSIVRFCEWLPEPWRQHKRVMRELLTRYGLDDDVVHPRLRENLGPVMDHGLHHHGAELLQRWARQGCILTEHGFLNPAGLSHAVAQAAGGLGLVDRRIFAVVALELALEQLSAC